MPVSWDSYKLVYNYMDTTYNIEVIKSKEELVMLDGVNVKNGTIKLINDKKNHNIVVYTK